MEQHPDTAELLDYLDDPASSIRHAHISQCVHCLNELVFLSTSKNRLRNLPELDPPDALWQRIENTLSHQAQPAMQQTQQEQPLGNRSQSNPRLPWIATAASLLFAFTVLVHQYGFTPASNSPAHSTNSVYITLLQESQQLESSIAFLDRQPGVRTISQAPKVNELRNSIATLDVALSAPDTDSALREPLLKKRVALLRQMLQFKAQQIQDQFQTF